MPKRRARRDRRLGLPRWQSEPNARTELVDLEEMSDEELAKLHDEFKQLHEKLAKKLSHRTGRAD